MTGRWAAPRAADPVDAVVALPGSKSITNRALVLGALAAGTTTLRHPLRSRDTDLMVKGLRALGADVVVAAGRLDVVGTAGRPRAISSAVDVGLAGTVARFLPPIAAISDRPVRFDGDPRMRERPIKPLVVALRDLGVMVSSAPGDRLPLTVEGGGSVAGGAITVDASSSSQLVSGLLLVAPCFTDGLTVRHVGPPVPSRPHLDMTVSMMRDFGAHVDQPDDDAWVVAAGGYVGREVDVEPDLSGASAFLAAATATGGRVVVPGWPAQSTQPGERLVEVLTAMGGSARLGPDGLELRGPSSVTGIEVDLRDAPEMTPAVAALAALATSPTRITGVAHIRLHETDRIAALAGELRRAGADVDELPDGLVIRPARLHGAVLRAHGDHRLAMAWAVLGLVVDGIEVDDMTTVAKTMPDFVERWQRMLGTGPSEAGDAADGGAS